MGSHAVLNSLIGDSRVMYFGLLGLAAIIALPRSGRWRHR